jgi:hypothetical protein
VVNGIGTDRIATFPEESALALRFDAKKTVDQNMLADLDRLIDDNNLATGSCRQIIHNGTPVYLLSATFE